VAEYAEQRDKGAPDSLPPGSPYSAESDLGDLTMQKTNPARLKQSVAPLYRLFIGRRYGGGIGNLRARKSTTTLNVRGGD